jgi:hypothetical protein
MMTDQVVYFDALLRNMRSALTLAIREQSIQLNVTDGEPDALDQLPSMSRRDEVVGVIDVLNGTLALTLATSDSAVKEDFASRTVTITDLVKWAITG